MSSPVPSPVHETVDIASRVLSIVQRVVGPATSPISLHEPEFRGREAEYLQDCIATGWVSSVGSYVDRFERDLAEATGTSRAVATANGTAALHVCLLLAGVEAGDEVLMPTLTFIATANAVSYCQAHPHFVDSEEGTLGVDADKLERHLHDTARVQDGICVNVRTGRPIRALVVMHVFGHPCDLDALDALARRWKLVLIEDAAESLGSYYHGRHTGNVGRISALSFNGNKVVTTGGGGAILTNDETLGKRAKHLTTTARLPHRWSFLHDEVGYNYRLPNLNAALGCAQLERLDDMLRRKRALAACYREAFAGQPGLRFFDEPAGSISNFWLCAFILAPQLTDERDGVLTALNDAGYMARPLWTLMHKLPMYAACPRMDVDVAERMEATLINVPSSPRLAEARSRS